MANFLPTLRLWRHEVRPTFALALPIMAGMVSQIAAGLSACPIGLAWRFHWQTRKGRPSRKPFRSTARCLESEGGPTAGAANGCSSID